MLKGKYLLSTNILLLLVLIVTLTSLILIFKLLNRIRTFIFSDNALTNIYSGLRIILESILNKVQAPTPIPFVKK